MSEYGKPETGPEAALEEFLRESSGGYLVPGDMAADMAADLYERITNPAAYEARKVAYNKRHRVWYRRLWRWVKPLPYRARWWLSNAIMPRDD